MGNLRKVTSFSKYPSKNLSMKTSRQTSSVTENTLFWISTVLFSSSTSFHLQHCQDDNFHQKQRPSKRKELSQKSSTVPSSSGCLHGLSLLVIILNRSYLFNVISNKDININVLSPHKLLSIYAHPHIIIINTTLTSHLPFMWVIH